MVLSILHSILLLVPSLGRDIPMPTKMPDSLKSVTAPSLNWIDTSIAGTKYEPAWTELCSLAVDVPDSLRAKISATQVPGSKEGNFTLTTDDSGDVVAASFRRVSRGTTTEWDRTREFRGLRLRPSLRAATVSGEIAWKKRKVLKSLRPTSFRRSGTTTDVPLGFGEPDITVETMKAMDSTTRAKIQEVLDSVARVRDRGHMGRLLGLAYPMIRFQYGSDGRLLYFELEELSLVRKSYPTWMLEAFRSIRFPVSDHPTPIYTLDFQNNAPGPAFMPVQLHLR